MWRDQPLKRHDVVSLKCWHCWQREPEVSPRGAERRFNFSHFIRLFQELHKLGHMKLQFCNPHINTNCCREMSFSIFHTETTIYSEAEHEKLNKTITHHLQIVVGGAVGSALHCGPRLPAKFLMWPQPCQKGWTALL